MGRHFTLDAQGRELTLSIDLTPNFHTRDKGAPAYLEVVNLAHNHHKLSFLRCSDNLLRARLIRFWDQVEQPVLRMQLDLGSHGRYLYTVLPHSLFVGGIQLDVQQVVGLLENEVSEGQAPGGAALSDGNRPRSHV